MPCSFTVQEGRASHSQGRGSEGQGICIDVGGSIGLHIVAEEAGRPCDALECIPGDLLNHYLTPSCDMELQDG